MEFARHIPFVQMLGMELRRCDGGFSELAWTPRPEHLNSHGALHGGAIMTLMDTTLAHAARTRDPSEAVVTIELKTSFMAPAIGPVVAHGELLKRTRKTAFVQARVVDAQGRLCAHATGTFRYVDESAPATTD